MVMRNSAGEASADLSRQRRESLSSKNELKQRLASTRHAAKQVRWRITCAIFVVAISGHCLVPFVIMGWMGTKPFDAWPSFFLMAPLLCVLHLAGLTILPTDADLPLNCALSALWPMGCGLARWGRCFLPGLSASRVGTVAATMSRLLQAVALPPACSSMGSGSRSS